MSVKKRDAHCKAIALSGKPCRAASTDSGFCFFHGHPNKAAELGSIGGKRNRRPSAGSADPLPPVDSATSAADNLDRIYEGVRTGAIAPRAATILMQVTIAKKRITDKMVIEREMAEMQDDLRTLKSMIRIRDIEALTSEEALTSQEALNSEGDLTSENEEPES